MNVFPRLEDPAWNRSRGLQSRNDSTAKLDGCSSVLVSEIQYKFAATTIPSSDTFPTPLQYTGQFRFVMVLPELLPE